MTPKQVSYYKKRLPEISTHCSARERVSVNAEREVVSLKKVRFMDNKIDQEFEGHITGVTSFGLFVELNHIFVEGLVHISSLTDHYLYDAKKHSLVGARFRNIYRLGDTVKIKVEGVSLEKREIRFLLLDEIPDKGKSDQKRALVQKRTKKSKR
jgi:ribonuclease R